MTIQAIYFDLGNVLLGIDWMSAVNGLQARSYLSKEEIGRCLMQSGFEAYELGQKSTQDFFSDLKRALDFRGTVEKLNTLCSDIFYELDKNIALARELSKHYRLGIISNTNRAHIDYVENKFNFFDVFETRIYSYEIKVRKPDPEIYEIALRALNTSARESLFIDDMEENVIAARNLGWKAIHLLPDTDLEASLRQHGIC